MSSQHRIRVRGSRRRNIVYRLIWSLVCLMRRIALVCIVLVGITVTTVATANNSMPRYQAGQDYKVLNNPNNRPASAPVHVKEFFLYSCPHCFQFESRLEKWVRHLGSDVQFRYSPVLFGRSSRTYARIYYTENALGMVSRLHDKVFDAIHRHHRPLARRATIGAFFKAHGISAKRFNQTFESQSLTKSMRRARKRMHRFDVRSVPSLAVAGRYWISGRTAGSDARMLKVADYLIAKTRRARWSKESK